LYEAKQIVSAKRDALFAAPIPIGPSPAVAFERFQESVDLKARHDRELRAAYNVRRDSIIGWTVLAIGCVAVGAFVGLAALGLRDAIRGFVP
jgi:hypothetical protein